MWAECEIVFQVQAHTELDEYVKIVGNIAEFGHWKTEFAMQLQTDNSLYPVWVPEKPLVVPKGTRLEFKLIKVKGTRVRWEAIPQDRMYRARYFRVVLKAQWDDCEGHVVVEKKFNSSVALNSAVLRASRKAPISNNFDPYQQASSDSVTQCVLIRQDNSQVNDSFTNSDEDGEFYSIEDFKRSKKRIGAMEESQDTIINHTPPKKKFSRLQKMIGPDFPSIYGKLNKEQMIQHLTIHDIYYDLGLERQALNKQDALVVCCKSIPLRVVYDKDKDSFTISEVNAFESHMFRAFQLLKTKKLWLGMPVITDQQNCPLTLTSELLDKLNVTMAQRHCKVVTDDPEEYVSTIKQMGPCYLLVTSPQLANVLRLVAEVNPRINSAVLFLDEGGVPNRAIHSCLLMASVLVFPDYGLAQTFLSRLAQTHDVQLRCVKGSVHVHYLGRAILVKIQSPGIQLSTHHHQMVQENVPCFTVLSASSPDLFMQMAIENPALCRNIKVYQMPTQHDLASLANQLTSINQKLFPNEERVFIEMVDVGRLERYYRIANLLVQGHSHNDAYLMEYIYFNKSPKSLVIDGTVSCLLFKSVTRFDDYEDFIVKFQEMYSPSRRTTESTMEFIQRASADKATVQKRQTITWLEDIFVDMKQAEYLEADAQIFVRDNRKIATSKKFSQLNCQQIGQVLQQRSHKVLIVQFKCLTKHATKLQQPMLKNMDSDSTRSYYLLDQKIITQLNALTKKYSVYVISDGPRFQLEKSLEGCSGVNLFAEGGYYYSQPNFGTWVPIFSHDVLNNQSILKVMKQYQQKTDGVKLRVTDTQIKWRYHHLVSDLARGIATDLQKHVLEMISRHTHLDVKHSNHLLVVKPAHLNQAILLEMILQKEASQPIGALVCIGRAANDNELLGTVQLFKESKAYLRDDSPIYGISVDLLPSYARYYVDDPVEYLLQNL